MSQQAVIVDDVTDGEVTQELSRILSSADFTASRHLSRFLRYVVEQSMAGEAELLKERTIALNALDRGRDFDSRLDPIVRVIAGKLRRTLDRYYAKEGMGNPLRIEIPKGGYRPAFRLANPTESGIPSAEMFSINEALARGMDDNSLGCPVVAVLPFVTFGGGEVVRHLADGMAQDLCIKLSGCSWIQVIDYLVARGFQTKQAYPCECALHLKADYCLCGTFRRLPSGWRVSVQFTQAHDGIIVWGSSFDLKSGANLHIDLDQAVEKIVLTLGDTFGLFARMIWSASREKKIEEATTIESLMRFFAYLSQVSDQLHTRTENSITRIVKTHPDFSLGWAALADLHLNAMALITKPGPRDASQQGLMCVQRALKADPTCAFAHWIQGLYHLLHGHIDESISAAERTVEHTQGSPFEVAAAGAMLSVNGVAERGQSLIDQVIRINPRLPGWIHWPVAIHQIGQGDYRGAAQTSEKFSLPDCFWDPMLRSVALAGTGDNDASHREMQHAIKLRPELASRPQELVGRVVKDPTVRDQIVEQVRAVSGCHRTRRKQHVSVRRTM